MECIDIDIEEMRSLLQVSDELWTITDNENNYSDEWKTLECLFSFFNDSRTLLENCSSAFSSILNYLDELEQISNQPPPDLTNIINSDFLEVKEEVQEDKSLATFVETTLVTDESTAVSDESNNEDLKNNFATINTNTKGLNVRVGKGTDSQILTSAPKGSTVEIITPDDGSGWTEVKLANGTQGFVSSKWLSFYGGDEIL